MKNHAGFWQRVAAFALDYIIILGYLLGIALLSLLVNQVFSVNQWLFGDRVLAQFVAFLLVTLPVTLYFAVSESSMQQATWGKGRLKLKVADRPNPFLESLYSHTSEIHSLGNLPYSDLANILFVPNGIYLD